MLGAALSIGFVLISLALILNLYRLLRGPDLPDRALALDAMYVNSIALLVLYGIQAGSRFYLQASILIALIGFVSTVAVAKHLLRGDIIE